MFSERHNGVGIVFTQHHTPGNEIKRSISMGDDVTLKMGEERVLVHDVVRIGSQRYKGRIYGFEPSMALEFSGLVVNQEIEFSESQVFGCSGA